MNVETPVLKAKDAPDLGKFDWYDPFRMNDQLTEEERMIRRSAQAYAQEKLQPRVIEAYATEKTEAGIFREMGDMGLLGVTCPEEYGGLGGSYVCLWSRGARDRAGRFRLPLDDVGAVLAGDVSDLCLRLRSAAAQIPAEAVPRATGSAVSA